MTEDSLLYSYCDHVRLGFSDVDWVKSLLVDQLLVVSVCWENLVKEQVLVSRSSAESEFRAMLMPHVN